MKAMLILNCNVKLQKENLSVTKVIQKKQRVKIILIVFTFF